MVRSRGKGNVLHRKLLRDMRRERMQFIAMILLCFLGTWVFSGLDGTWRLIEKTVETYISECNLTDLWVNAASFDGQDIKRLEHIDGVKKVLPRTSIEVDTKYLGEDVTLALECYGGEMDINSPWLREGELLRQGDIRGCLVEEQFARAHGLSAGDTVTVSVSGQQLTFIVRGLVLSAEYISTSKSIAPDPFHYGFMLVRSEAIPMLPFTNVLIDLEEGVTAEQIRPQVEKAVPGALIVTQKTHNTISNARNNSVMFRGLTYVFPVLAFGIAALIVVTTLKRMIDTQRIQIGVLKALGYDNRRIRSHYLCYALVPSVIGSSIGVLIGHYTLPDILWKMISHNSRYPYMLRAPISWISYLMAFFSVLLAIGICAFTYNKASKETAAELLRPKAPKGGSRILLERWKWLWNRFSFNTKMVIRNVLRHKGRTMVMLSGIMLCNMLIIATFGLTESIVFFIGQYYGGTLQYEYRVGLKNGMAGTAESYAARNIADTVEGIMDYSVTVQGGGNKRAVLLTVLSDGQELFHLAEDQQILQMPDAGLVISRKLAKVMGISLGEHVLVTFTGETDPVELVIEQFADTNIGQQLFLGRKAWEKLRKGEFRPNALLLKGVSDEQMHLISEMDETDTVKRLSEQREQTSSILDATKTAFSIMSAVALGLAFVICYNMGLLNFTERIRDFATLKVLGYHKREIRRLMIRERNITAFAGVLLSIIPGIGLVGVILKTCEYDSMVFVSYTSAWSVIKSCFITYAFTLFIEGLLTRKVDAIDMVEALKSVE